MQDDAGNYLLMIRSTGPELYNSKSGVLIKKLLGQVAHSRYSKFKLNSFLPHNKLITLNEHEAALWQLHPIDWSKVSSQEKMAFLILEHNYKAGLPLSEAAMAHIDVLQELAQCRYPSNASLQDAIATAIPFEIYRMAIKHEEEDGTATRKLFIFQKEGQGFIHAEKKLTGSCAGQTHYQIYPTSVSNRADCYLIPEEKARLAYYFLHKLFNGQPKKD